MGTVEKIKTSSVLFFVLLTLFLTSCESTDVGNLADGTVQPALSSPETNINNIFTTNVSTTAGQHDLTLAAAEFNKYDFEPQEIEPLKLVVTRRLEQMGEYDFTLNGFLGKELNNEESYSRDYVMINSIEIKANNGDFYQLIDGFSSLLSSNFENYGIEFFDWNGDGYTDIRLHQFQGGTSHNEPSLFWLWDNAEAKFIQNKQLEELSDCSAVYIEPEKDSRVRSFIRKGPRECELSYYKYNDGEFIKVECKNDVFYEKDGAEYIVTKISELINGKMKIVSEATTRN